MTKKKLLKRKRKNSVQEIPSKDDETVPPPTRQSDETIPKKVKWINKERVLVFASRGVSMRDRHLMKDIKRMMPHARDENKMERRENLMVVNELCEMKNCNKCIFLEGRQRKDLYMWLANVPNGPSAKFLVESVFTMGELKLTGNCLKGSRPLLSYDESFKSLPHYSLLKELFTQIFGVPNHHPKSQPFFDRIITFTVLDNRIWFRQYQILTEDGALAEIGPRFVLNPIKIFDGSFNGATLWENSLYVSPAKYRRRVSQLAGDKYTNRQEQRIARALKRPETSYPGRPEEEIFSGDTIAKAAEITGTTLPAEAIAAVTRPVKLTTKRKIRKRKRKQAMQT